MSTSTSRRLAPYLLLCTASSSTAFVERAKAQAVVAAWGNVEGMRVDGEVFPFEISLCTVNDVGVVIGRTAKERQQPRYSRMGRVRTITTRLGPFSMTETVEDTRRGEATLDLHLTADSATDVRGFLCIDAPRASYAAVRVIDGSNSESVIAESRGRSSGGVALAEGIGRGVSFESANEVAARRVEISASSPLLVLLGTDRREGRDVHRVLLPVVTGRSAPGRSIHFTCSVKASGKVDHSPMTLAIDASKPGRVFDGLGGNFRIQNPRLDPQVIAYNLANLRVAWARVEMPWRSWNPDTSSDPATVDTAHLDPKVRAAMEMARTAAAAGAPVIVSAWFPPLWAVIGQLPRGGQRVNGQLGNQLDPAKIEKIYSSITSYLLYLKGHYGVEAAMFSFNESDLGIDVRQTPQEHGDLIKGLGAFMKGKGLSTTMLLGDVSDATPTSFIAVAMRDSATWPYIGAVSYHSWRGWSDSLLTFWNDAAKRINVPLLVGEGSTDAGAYRYPAIFQEPDFALMEIELYVRMLALSEPKSILQWQLTSDYSLLAGGGVFGDSSALRPTQRFWNLKQLASTPEHVAHLPVHCGGSVSCAALANVSEGSFAMHVVNNGASRAATITGVPAGITSLRVWRTDAERAHTEGPRIPVHGGRAVFTLDAATYTTLIATRRVEPRT